MKQQPSNFKYRKPHRVKTHALYTADTKNFRPIKGSVLIKSICNGKMTYVQMEACRRALKRLLRQEGSIFIRFFTNFARTKKAIATRMGTGKGSHSYWEGNIRAGQVVCEILSTNYKLAYIAGLEAIKKLPFKAKVIFQYY